MAAYRLRHLARPGNNRVVQILFTNPATGQVQLRSYDDVPPRDAAPKTRRS